MYLDAIENLISLGQHQEAPNDCIGTGKKPNANNSELKSRRFRPTPNNLLGAFPSIIYAVERDRETADTSKNQTANRIRFLLAGFLNYYVNVFTSYLSIMCEKHQFLYVSPKYPFDNIRRLGMTKC